MSNPGVNEMLGWLEALKSAITDFAAQEGKLNRDFHAKAAAAQAAFEIETKRQLDALAGELDDAEIYFQSDTQAIQARAGQRQTRIAAAHDAVKSRIVGGITAEETRRQQQNQAARRESEQLKADELLAAENDFQTASHQVAELRATWAEVDHAARKIFRGHGAFNEVAAEQKIPFAHESEMLAETEKLIAEVRAQTDGKKGSLFSALFQRGETAPVAVKVAAQLARAKRLLDIAEAQATARHPQDIESAETGFIQRRENLNQQFKELMRWATDARVNEPLEATERSHRATQRNETQLHARLARAERTLMETCARLKAAAEIQARQRGEAHQTQAARWQADHATQWDALVADWKKTIHPLYEQIRAANESAAILFPPWNQAYLGSWQPFSAFTNAARFAHLEVDLEKFTGVMPKDPRLALPGPANFFAPLSLVYPSAGSILLETTKGGGDEAGGVINNIIYRLLATTPPGKLNFTIFDPVGLGQNFAGLMHLADYDDSNLINSRIWTQPNQFEEKLAELSEHMEKVIQMYLRNEYATIAEYNAQAGTIAEKYHVLVIASFPVNFTDTAAKRLRNIAASGARCGVYTLIHWDQRNAPPADFVPDELRKNSIRLVRSEAGFNLANWKNPGAQLVLAPPPSAELATEFLHLVGERSKDANRVEVPFAQIAPDGPDIWSEVTTNELRVPIGRSGATKLQYLAIGKDTRQHALIAGKTGSGKSTLFHVIITNLALWCSPEQVEFYLVDFKKGVEFKCYANRKLPHARVVAIESDREFGLSVLQRVDEELARRGDLFRRLGAQDVAGYKRAGGTEAMPRALLMIDEFQEFFTEEDRISQGAAVLLDRIVRQGRAFGIHVVLGSQTLGGAYTLARATIGQMVIRIALQCNEADAYLIMDQDNPAPRLLSRPGEGIYNDTAGSIEGNAPFQAVWLADTVRDDYLQRIRERAGEPAEKYPGPFVFEGSAPADVQENYLLNASLKTPLLAAPAAAAIWLGAPNSIKGPTEARFQRQSGSNLLLIGQNDEATLSILAVSLVALAAQYPPGTVKFVVLDSTAPGSLERDFLERIFKLMPQEVIRAKSGEVAEVMNGLAEELKSRSEESSAGTTPEIFLFIHGLHNFKKLRPEDEFSFSSSSDGAAQPAAILTSLINEGPARGIHVIATCDSGNNANRFLGRKNLSEFEMRVLFQMSASDSAALIDAPDAATLGLHRALFYNDREGYLETFRPYARPGSDWIELAARRLKSVLTAAEPK
ncbi:MAG TPA: FtsK/SpoIIIE domain-containing protein [Verrucomicrobiae bacterium]